MLREGLTLTIDLKYIKTEVNNLNIALPLYHESVRAYQEYVLNYTGQGC